MSLRGRRIAILAERQYEDLELWYPKLRLEEAGAHVVVAGPGEKVYHSKHGYPVDVDASVADLRADDFDGVVIPGGWAPDYLRRDASVTAFVKAVSDAGKLVAAICHGGSVLVSAGVLQGRRLTSVTAISDDLRNAGATWTDAEVVVDANLVTSRRPDDLPAFLKAIISVLQAKDAPREPDSRMDVDGDLISIRLDETSFAYMVEMLNRMPNARGYTEDDFDPGSSDVRAVLADFVRESDPKGSLEAAQALVVDVERAEGGYVARGSSRLLTVLQGADVPEVSEL